MLSVQLTLKKKFTYDINLPIHNIPYISSGLYFLLKGIEGEGTNSVPSHFYSPFYFGLYQVNKKKKYFHILGKRIFLKVHFHTLSEVQDFERLKNHILSKSIKFKFETVVYEFIVEDVKIEPIVEFENEQIFKVYTPTVLTVRNEETGRFDFIRPSSQQFTAALKQDIMDKYFNSSFKDVIPAEWQNKEISVDLVPFEKHKKTDFLITTSTKTMKIHATYGFHIRVSAPNNMLKIIYYTGLGRNNNIGCGYLLPVKEMPIVRKRID